ncbi:hypothetical protein [Sphingobacterium bovistauri]|uniref:Esterase n=1 Tax=Sphingobacterium bovistauri TaxID=2781959 RepID=A0ABS7Z870_9SPHI|nr:hypothetical protein [Sphingobacterium bovistauri]MCA5006349.1 hypothetical protein [Sphingobacterium bovistauri]
MLKFNSTLLLLSFSFICCLIPASAQSSEQDSLIVKYFRERIADYEKSGNYKFEKGNILSLKDVKISQGKIWNLWKIANTTFEKLPTKFPDNPQVLADIPVHTWQLKGEEPMPFYYIKKKEKPATGYPIFLNLHGSGPKDREFLSTLGLSYQYKDGATSYIVPQIPSERRYRWWFKSKQYAWENLIRMIMIDDTFNPNKFYMMGISEGGYGSQRLGAFYADYLAGAGPMAGGEPLHNAPPINFRHIAFSFETGEFDHMFGRNKLTQSAKDQFDSLSNVYPGNYVHKINIQKGKGHGIDYSVTTPWLVQYSRTPRPTSYEWILFAMDGRYRQSFYNIAITKPLNIAEGDEYNRASFIFNIDKKSNTIYLNDAVKNSDLSKSKPLSSGSIDIYLSDDMIDLSKKIKVIYDGKKVFNKKVKLAENNLIESCAIFNDPERIFPAKIALKLN